MEEWLAIIFRHAVEVAGTVLWPSNETSLGHRNDSRFIVRLPIEALVYRRPAVEIVLGLYRAFAKASNYGGELCVRMLYSNVNVD